ncbi:hypothetical protein HCH_02156 [Hahella chejuensis KCTC 2396]|uniref:Uncharacterized protein n=1 Tax=Hahella chejuensis (strain KCTC 2396) TaxID=349521 RepID=Q2SK38_HAHCH|nr:hypothetical protein HCH_02156 [Hahella chejuensis KCTC 2396]
MFESGGEIVCLEGREVLRADFGYFFHLYALTA